nr:dihydrofolate reductase family protein [Anabaena catenula]
MANQLSNRKPYLRRITVAVKTSVFIATSLDGFIARLDGSIDWLNQANTVVPHDEDCGYATFMATVDVIVMGRNTFEQVLTFGEWPYGDKKVVVLSRKGIVIPEALRKTVSTSSAAPESLIEMLSLEGVQNLYIDGGQTIHSFLSAGLLNELTITTIPILLGSGKPLFGVIKSDILLKHVITNAYAFGFVQSKYDVLKAAPHHEL